MSAIGSLCFMLKTRVDMSVCVFNNPAFTKVPILCSFQFSFETVSILPFPCGNHTAHSILGTDTLWFVQGGIMCPVFPGLL